MTSPEIERRTGLSGAVALKAPVKVATTVNITLVGEQTINGVAVVDGDRVLVKNQTAGADNGIWIASTGDWQRAPDWDANGDVVKGTRVWVTSGTAGAPAEYAVTTDDDIVIGTTIVVIATSISAAGYLTAANNLSDVANAGTARSNLGLGSVNNTSDADKPVSTAQQTALNLKADSASPTLTGDPKAPTPSIGDNDTSIATTAFVQRDAGTEFITFAPNANQNNYALGVGVKSALSSIINLEPTISLKITGIDTTGWDAGKQVTLRNNLSLTGASGRLIILERNSASSNAANRLKFVKARDRSPIFLCPGDEATFRFDGTDLKLIAIYPGFRWEGDLRLDGLVNAFGAGVGTGVSGVQYLSEIDANGVPWSYGSAGTGTTATGAWASGGQMNTAIRAGVGCLLGVYAANIPILSTGAEEYSVFIGFHDAIENAAAGVVDGIGWQYKRTSSTFWQTFTRSNSAETLVAQALTVAVNTYTMFGVFVNGDGTRCDYFYSTDAGETWTFTAAITTNIPTGTARVFGGGYFIAKTVGVTARVLKHWTSSLFRWLQ